MLKYKGMNDTSDSSDMPVITDEMVNDYIRRRNLRRVILIVCAIAVVASAIAAFFVTKANEAEEERRRAEREKQFLNDPNLITYNGDNIIASSDLASFLKSFATYYGTFTVHGKRADRETDLKTFLNSDKCASSSASWKGWLGTSDYPKQIEINGFIKSGDADSCLVSNLRVDSFVLRTGIVKKKGYELDIDTMTANQVLDYFDIEDSEVRYSNSMRMIRIKELDTSDFTAEFWYDDNIYGEDPVKLIYTYSGQQD